jgi:hypothetical protein
MSGNGQEWTRREPIGETIVPLRAARYSDTEPFTFEKSLFGRVDREDFNKAFDDIGFRVVIELELQH